MALDRLENEHLGDMDQYRITREVPLPYSFDALHPESDDDEGGDEHLRAPLGRGLHNGEEDGGEKKRGSLRRLKV